jgi:AcrR family transcriptional regulator
VRSPEVKGTEPGSPAPAGRFARVPASTGGGQQERAQQEHAQREGAKREQEAERDRAERYRRLPTGAHGLAPEEVERDQRERLRRAMIELIAERGYPAVRILDLTKLAHVSRPTFYALYRDKEALLLEAYEEIAARAERVIMQAYDADLPPEQRLSAAMRAFAEIATAQPEAMSLFLLGAFGAGPRMLERRNAMLGSFEQRIQQSRDGAAGERATGLTVKFILGGIREVTAGRLIRDHADQLPGLADELAAWASSYPPELPSRLRTPPPAPRDDGDVSPRLTPPRARRVEGRLPSGRHDLPREVVVKSQRERIVDATAAIVAEKGLAGLTIPEIASRANVSHETFYEMYQTKQDAFVGAQKVGMHQALGVAVEAFEGTLPDWPRAIAAGLRALIAYLVSEPAHAHLSIVDAFGASPETIKVRNETLTAFATYFRRGYELAREEEGVPAIGADAGVGGAWQVLHHEIENERIAELPDTMPQLIYLLLTPFIGPKRAAKVALEPPAKDERVPGAATNGSGERA